MYKRQVLTSPYQAISLPKNRTVLGLSSESNKIPIYTGSKGKIQGEKNDSTPAKKTETEKSKMCIRDS